MVRISGSVVKSLNNALIYYRIQDYQRPTFFPPRNGVERLREGKGILPPNVSVLYEPK